MHVGLLSGSSGEKSANRSILAAAERHLATAGRGRRTTWVSGLELIPFFRAELVDEPPAAVAAFRRQVHAVDVLLIAAPEYAAGVAGGLKNALDWLVGDATLDRKIVGVASAGTTGGGGFAIEQLVRTVSWQGGYVMSTLGIAAPRTKSNDDGVFTDTATLEDIAAWADAVVAASDGTAADRLAALTQVVAPYAIDPARFGTIE